MATSNTYDQGTKVRVSNINQPFTTLVSGTPTVIDPDHVKFVCLKSDGITYIRATYTKLTGDPSNTIVRDALGVYHADVTTDMGSATVPWKCRLYVPAGDNGESSAYREFFVSPDGLV